MTYNRNEAIAFAYGESFDVVKKPAIVSGRKRAEKDVGGAIGASINDKLYERDSKN